MKKILAILLIFVAYNSFGQSIVNRATAGNTVQDQRWMAGKNAYVPRYADTTTASLPPNIGIDSCGAIIFTYDIMNFWVRACSPKSWQRVTAPSALVDGVYMGGDVVWSGAGYVYNVSAATFVLNGVLYNTPQGTVTLDPADVTFDRIDVIGLTASGPDKVTGVASSNPQEPSVNPQIFIRRAIVAVAANSVQPNVDQRMIYDQGTGLPDEWTPTTTGTVDFLNTSFPYHLTIAAAVTGFTTSQDITFTYSDTIQSGSIGNLAVFVRLGGLVNSADNLNIQLLNAGVAVSPVLNFTNFGMSRSIINGYQTVIFPMPAFGSGNIIFDGIKITTTGAFAFPAFNLDYIQLQTGIVPVVTERLFALQDNFANQARAFNQNNFDFRYYNGNLGVKILPTTTVPYTFSVGSDNGGVAALGLHGDGSSSIIEANAGASISLWGKHDLRFIPSFGVTGGFIIVAPLNSQYIKQDFYTGGAEVAGSIYLNSLGGANEFALKPLIPPTLNVSTYLNLYGPIKLSGIPNAATPDSIVTITGDSVTRTAYSVFSSTYYNANIGSGFRLAHPFTNNISTLFSDVTGAWDSTSNSNALTYKVDTTVIATRGFANNLLTTYFNTNVGSSFRLAIPGTNQIKTLTSGYSLTWDSATSNTLKISIDTTLMATRAYVGAAGGAGTVSAFSFANANGFLGNVTNSTTTPQLTISTSVNGIVKGNGTAISAATSGTDYSAGTSALATGILKSTTATGALSIAVANTDYITPSVTTLPSLTTASALATVGTLTSGSISTGFIVRGVTMTLGGDASFDTYYRSAGGVLTRLANGTTGQFLGANTGAAPSWKAVAATITINSSAITGGTAGRILFQNAANQVSQSANLFWDNTNSRLGIGTAAPTALIQVAAGTTAAAPFKFTSGTNLTTAASGAMEYDGTNFYLTPSSAVRKRIVLTNNATPANGQIPIGNGTDYTVANITATNNGMVITNGAGSISLRMNSTVQVLTDGATITLNAANGYNGQVTLGGTGRTLVITNPVAGLTYTFRIIQDGTGNRTITTWPSGTRWPGGTPIVLSTTANAIDMVSFYYDGSNYYAAFNKNYQ